MKYYFCLLSKDDVPAGTNPGRRIVYENRSEWVEKPADEISKYLTAGYVKGVDYVVSNNKAYWIYKSFIDIDEDFVVIAAVESITGCDI